MKPNLLPPILSALLLAGTTTDALADAWVTSRSRCYWGVNRFVASTIGKICWDIQREAPVGRGCSWATSWVELYPCYTGIAVRSSEDTRYQPYFATLSPFQVTLGTAHAYVDPSGATVYTSGGYGSYGYINETLFDGSSYACTGTGEVCMGGAGAGLLFPATGPASEPLSPSGARRSARLNTGTREYDARTRTMVVRGVRARLRNNPYDRVNEFSALHVSVLRSADNKQDSLNQNNDRQYLDHLLASSRAMLNNGKLTLEGALRDARVTVQDSAGYQIADLVLDELRLHVPEDVNPDEVTLQLGSDIGLLSAGVSPRYLPGAAALVRDVAPAAVAGETLEFSNYPNPVQAGTAATVEARTTTTEPVTIALYDATGRRVRTVYSGVLQAKALRSFPVDLQAISAGIYYLRLERKGSRLTRRVVVQ
jgi:hypothetical protein